MKQESLTLAGHAASGLTVGISGANKMGWFDFISANASGISVILGCCSLISAICFYIISYRKHTLADENKKTLAFTKDALASTDKKLDNHIIETRAGLNEILNRLPE